MKQLLCTSWILLIFTGLAYGAQDHQIDPRAFVYGQPLSEHHVNRISGQNEAECVPKSLFHSLAISSEQFWSLSPGRTQSQKYKNFRKKYLENQVSDRYVRLTDAEKAEYTKRNRLESDGTVISDLKFIAQDVIRNPSLKLEDRVKNNISGTFLHRIPDEEVGDLAKRAHKLFTHGLTNPPDKDPSEKRVRPINYGETNPPEESAKKEFKPVIGIKHYEDAVAKNGHAMTVLRVGELVESDKGNWFAIEVYDALNGGKIRHLKVVEPKTAIIAVEDDVYAPAAGEVIDFKVKYQKKSRRNKILNKKTANAGLILIDPENPEVQGNYTVIEFLLGSFSDADILGSSYNRREKIGGGTYEMKHRNGKPVLRQNGTKIIRQSPAF